MTTNSSRRARFLAWWIEYRWWWLVLAVVASFAAWRPAARLEFEQSVESFYAADNPHLRDYLESKQIFGGDEWVAAVFADPQLFGADGRLSAASGARLRRLAEDLEGVPGVEPRSARQLADLLTFERFPMLSGQREQVLELVEGILVGEDRQTTAVTVRLLPPSESTVSRRETLDGLRALAARSPGMHLVGEAVQIDETFRYVEEDALSLGWIATAVLMVALGVVFRRWRWLLLPVAVVEATILLTRGLLVLCGLRLSMVSSVMNSLLLVVGTATVIHVVVRFRERRLSTDARTAATLAMHELAHPTFWATITTAAGFAIQMTSHVTPVRSFGVMMGVGTLVMLVAAAMIVPAWLVGSGPPESAAALAGTRVGRALLRCHDWVERYPRRVVAAFGTLVLLAIGGSGSLRVETDFSRNFRSHTPVVQALDFVESRLGGASIWEVHFAMPADWNGETLQRVARLAERIRTARLGERPLVTKALAVTDGLNLIPWLPVPAKRTLLKQLLPEFESLFFRPERQRMRILLRSHDRQRVEDRVQAIEEVARLAREEFPDAKPAGLFVLLTYLVDSLVGDQWVSLVLGILVIGGLMTIAFGSLRIGLVSLVPNLLPILLVVGAMGWLGIPINLGTAMIASVSLGLTIDSSIHYFAGYRQARRSGLAVAEALRTTSCGVGSALVDTNLALLVGFLTLTASHFLPLVYFGLLVAVAMVGGLAGNLCLLPILIRALRIEGSPSSADC